MNIFSNRASTKHQCRVIIRVFWLIPVTFHLLTKAIVTVLYIFAFLSLACADNKNDAPEPPRGYPSYTLLKAAVAIGLVKLVDTKPAVPAELNEYRDLEYCQAGDRSLKLDLYQPKDLQQPTPVLVFIHGGGWKSGKKEDYLVYLVDFARRGYVTASISYRLAPENPFPAAVQDVKCAIRWIRAHANAYQIDPDKIAVIGGSAGGHLAMMIGYSADVPTLTGTCNDDSVTCQVQAVVNLYGPTDLTTEYGRNHTLTRNFIGQSYETAPELYRQASPIHYITPDDPPTLIFHGTLDDLVPVSQSDTLKSRLDAAGVRNEYHRLKWWPHTMDLAQSVNAYCQYYMTAFFEKHIPK